MTRLAGRDGTRYTTGAGKLRAPMPPALRVTEPIERE